jgi:hypothetical protein
VREVMASLGCTGADLRSSGVRQWAGTAVGDGCACMNTKEGSATGHRLENLKPRGGRYLLVRSMVRAGGAGLGTR